jgi:hypothetical protein
MSFDNESNKAYSGGTGTYVGEKSIFNLELDSISQNDF